MRIFLCADFNNFMVTDFEHVDDVLFKMASKGAEDRRFVVGAG